MRRSSFGHSLNFIIGNFAIATLRGFAAALVLVSLCFERCDCARTPCGPRATNQS